MTGELFSDMDLFGYEQVDISEAIADQDAAEAAEAERVAALEAEALTVARAHITAGLPSGAADRWVAALVAEVEEPAPADTEPAVEVEETLEVEPAPVVEPVVEHELVVINTARGDIRVHAAECGDVARDRARYGTMPVPIRAADRWGVVGDFMSDFIDEGYDVEELGDDFVWLGCCADLPWAAGAAEELDAEVDQDGDEPTVETEPEVDLGALGMTPRMRDMVLDLEAGPWHYQTRHKAHEKGLVTSVKAVRLTQLGERVRAALQSQ
mgnify:FL=1